MTTVVNVVNHKGQLVKARAFLDQGSQASFVAADLVQAISAPKVKTAMITIQGFGAPAEQSKAALHRLEIVDCQGTHHMIRAYKRNHLDLSIEPVSQDIVERWRRRGVEVSDAEHGCTTKEIQVLIGANHANQFLQEPMVINGEAAWKTRLGWVLSGPSASQAQVLAATNVAYVHNQIEALWELEQPQPTSKLLPAFPLTKQKGRYEVGLLWKGAERPHDNKSQAIASANSLINRLKRKGSLAAYEDVLMKEYQELDAIERDPEPHCEGYFMPHHAVVRQGAATTKVRVVFNASAKQEGKKSLNEVLEPGPSLIPDLTGMLLRFREFQSAVQADIKKAFFAIAIKPEDRTYLRFMWPDSKGRMEVWRLKKLPFGVNCSPFILSATIRHHLQEEKQRTESEELKSIIHLLEKSFYVDDCVTSVPSASQAVTFQEGSRAVLATAGMDLRKWRGNTLGDCPDAAQKVLGVARETESDALCIIASEEVPKVWTRSLLKILAGVFDPLGLVVPFTIAGKILLQRSWKEKTGWDTPFQGDLSERVQQWGEEVRQLSTLKTPGWSGAEAGQEYELHLFTDASESALGCIIYLVQNGSAHLLYAKSRVLDGGSNVQRSLKTFAAALKFDPLSDIISSG